MLEPLIPPNDELRVAALRAYDILDTVEEEIYDAITRAAAHVCGAPMALLSFVDKDRQWFKSRVGIDVRQTSRAFSICAHAINGRELFVVEDLSIDQRFNDNPLVSETDHMRFYAGIPLIDSAGYGLGTLCVLDTVARGLSPEQAESLKTLADNALRIMNARRDIGVSVFAKAVDMANDGVTISAPDAEGGATVIYANESFLQFARFNYHEVINKPCTFPLSGDLGEVQNAFETARREARMTTVVCRFETAEGKTVWDRIAFIPYIDSKGELVYMVAIHRDVTVEKEVELQSQQLHAMRTTLATVEHVIRNFMNTAQLYSFQASSGAPVDAGMQRAFDAAMQKTHHQLAAISGMTAFKDRATPFGVSILDTDSKM